MVVGMRRTTRVFGVVKSGDGARILRSGRRLYSDPSDVVSKSKKSNSGKVEWLNLLDSDEDQNKVKTGWSDSQVSVKKAEIKSEFRNEVCDLVAGLENVSQKKIVKVYERKRKRFDWDAKPDGLAGYGKSCGVGRKFGNHFVRRQLMRKMDIVGSVCRPGLVVTCTSVTSARWLSRLLNSVLAYLMNHEVKLSKLHGFLCSNPIGSVFESQGIQFLQKFSGCSGTGYCKIYGVTQFTPLFSVNFSAIPACFMNLYSSMFLRFEKLVFTYLVNLISKNDNEVLDDDNELLFRIASNDHTAGVNGRSTMVNNIRKRNITHIGIEGGQGRCHRMRLRSSFSSSNIKGKRSAPRSRRGRQNSIGAGFENSRTCVSTFGLQKKYDASKLFEMPIADLACKSMNENHSIGLLRELKDSTLRWGNSDFHSSSVSNKRARIVGSSECGQHNGREKVTDFESCAASILVIDHDRCYRVEGASVMLELSPSNRWLIVVKKDGFTKYSHMAEMVMKPCTFNRATHNIIWTINNDCKLEFPTREDWSIFKELYKACSSKNLNAPNNNIIPVPGVRVVSNYEDTVTASYSRPDEYIRLDGSEVSRVLARTSASYDIDSEDEEWLANYNEKICLHKENHRNVSTDTLEQIIDAIEKALYISPSDYLDQRSISDICAKLGNQDVIEDAYIYWSKKRKLKHPTLVRVLQAYKQRQVLDVGGPVMRKKRSFKRHSNQNGGGMKRYFFEGGEQLSVMELEETNALATRYSEWATHQRKRAQALMEYADLATYKAAIAVKIAQAANDASVSAATAASMILI